jgi:hypothetical protein
MQEGILNLKREAEIGKLYFDSACFAAINGDKIKCVKQLLKALEYGFSDGEAFEKELTNINSLKRCKKEIEEVIDTAQLKMKTTVSH